MALNILHDIFMLRMFVLFKQIRLFDLQAWDLFRARLLGEVWIVSFAAKETHFGVKLSSGRIQLGSSKVDDNRSHWTESNSSLDV